MIIVDTGLTEGDILDEIANILEPLPDLDPSRQVSVAMMAEKMDWTPGRSERELNAAVKKGLLIKKRVMLPTGRAGNAYEKAETAGE
jgi:predicted transcriptional regulator